MKITKAQLSKLIKEELEQVQTEQQLNENPAMIAQVVKHLPQIMELVKMLPEISAMMKSMGGEGAAGAGGTADTTPDLTPASE
jgi:hypothetical protein